MATLRERLEAAQAGTQSAVGDLKGRLLAAREKVDAGEMMQPGEASRVGFFDRSVNTVASIPAGISELAAQGLALPPAAINAVGGGIRNQFQGQPADLMGEFLSNRQNMLQTEPLKSLQNFPRPPENLGEQFRAFGSTLDPRRLGEEGRLSGIMSGDVLKQARVDEARRTEQARELFPGRFTAGEVGSDVLGAVGLRGNLSRARAPGRAAERLAIIDQARRQLIELPPGVSAQVNDVFTDKVIPFFKSTGRNIKTGTGKAIETGMEGALFAAINDGDIESSFGLAAGGQGAGSLALSLVTKPNRHLLPAVATAWLISEMTKAVGPGDQDFFASKDFAIQKLTAVMGLGAAAALSGAGRFRGPLAERFPAFMDAITTVPRTVLVSRMAEMTKAAEEGNEAPMKVMQRFVANPNAFSTDQQNALNRAMNSAKEFEFTKEVNRLMGNDDFVRRLTPPDLSKPEQRLRSFTPTQPIQRN